MRPACEEPSLTSTLEIWARYPNCARHRELRHRVLDLHGVDLLHDESHPAAHVDERCGDCRPRRRVEDETAGGFLTADTERMDLERRLRVTDRRAHFEHVRAQDALFAFDQMVGVLLHERDT